MSSNNIFFLVFRALSRARLGILTIALTYGVSVIVGVGMVAFGNKFALNYRDSLVSRADASDLAAISLENGHRLQAALLDFGGNLFLGALPNTVAGLGVILPYPFVFYRGWVGGIVSANSDRTSRLADPAEAFYYLLTLVLQLIPYSLAGGAGVTLGMAYLRPRPIDQGKKWLGLPREAVLDVLRIYLLVVPLFLAASLWEFLAR